MRVLFFLIRKKNKPFFFFNLEKEVKKRKNKEKTSNHPSLSRSVTGQMQ